MNARFWFWWSAIFGPICLLWAVWMATGLHWLVAGASGAGAIAHGVAGRWQYKHIPPRIPAPNRHDLALAEIDRLERELRMGKYTKTEGEFDAEVEAAVHPFRHRLGSLRLLLGLMLTDRSGRWRSHSGRTISEIGSANAALLRAMMGDPDKD